ncbi:caspase, EACC1-associated type [Actinokineospora inagensis]|uniref:caspase, EACC1-associated type n=1 Tax=Actinokineospora inagensis TaxID=103730 RepID=UPI000417D816|nr:caspase family protein [Actinokineospora inagensis]
MSALSARGTRVVLMGTGTHGEGSDLPDIEAVGATVRGLGQVLVDRCGLAEGNLRVAVDQATPERLGVALAEQAEQAEDLLLVYFVGHGLVSLSGELHLATGVTDRRPSRLGITALPYSQVRNCVLESRARASVVILDCCFSGRAVGALGDPMADVTAMAHISGTYVLTSAGRDQVALAPPGATYTAFTGELINLLTNGAPKEPRELTLRDVSRYLRRVLPAKGLPKPRYEAREGAEDLVLAVNPAHQGAAPPVVAPARSGDGGCPYPGLASFQEDQARWFFGRERATRELVGRLVERMDGVGPLVVAGPSGAGKSSLLRAGLLPAFRQGKFPVPGSRGWPRLLLTPTALPDQKLADLVAGRIGDEPGRVIEGLRSRPESLADMLHAALAEESPGDVARMLIVVDQFEEVFTLCDDEHRRQTFVNALCAASTSTDDRQAPALVVLGMRADLLGNCARYPELVNALRYGQVMLGAMTTAELREVVEKPGHAAGLTIEPGLTDRIVDEFDDDESRVGEAAYNPARLPLLAHALHTTWEQRRDGTLTITGYAETGGINGAIRTTADTTYRDLSPVEQDVARDLLLHLVNIGEDGDPPTRGRAAVDRLVAESGHPEAATAVLTALERARLVTADKSTVEITHEALLREWPLLRDWIEADRAGLLIRQRLTAATQRWADSGRDADLLYPAGRLAEVTSWELEHRSDIATHPTEQDFIRFSRAKRGRERLRRRLGVAALAVFAVVAVTASVIAVGQYVTAADQRDSASARGLVALTESVRDSSPQLALRLSVAAYRLYPGVETNANLVTTLLTTRYAGAITEAGGVSAVAYSPHGNVVAVGINNGTTGLWDVSEPDRPRLVGTPVDDRTNSTVVSIAFSPDGNTMAVGSSAGTATLWDVTVADRPRLIGKPVNDQVPDAVTSVAFAPDGKTLAVGSSGAVTTLWRISGGTVEQIGGPLRGHSSRVSSVAFATVGTTLVTGSDDSTTLLWDVSVPDHPVRIGQPLRADPVSVTSVAVSPDGHTLATGSSAGVTTLWDITKPGSPRQYAKQLSAHDDVVSSLAFAPDGNTLVSGSHDGTAVLWDVTHPANPTQIPDPLVGHRDEISSVAFAPGGTTVVTGGDDGTAIIWDVTNRPRRLGQPLPGHRNPVISVRFDGDTLVSTSLHDRTIRWDLTDPTTPRQAANGPSTGDSALMSLATTADGRTDATAGPDNSVILWDITDRTRPRQLGPTLTGQGNLVSSAAFTADGKLLATGGADGSVLLWDVANPTQPRRLGQPLTGHRKPVSSLGFSRDGHTLAAGSSEGKVILWDVREPARPYRLGQPLAGQDKSVLSLAFSPDGKILATGGDDNAVTLWDLTDLDNALDRACAVAGGGLTAEEWARHITELPYRQTC